MEIIGDVLRQAFMPRHEYESLREEEKAWGRLQRPLAAAGAAVVGLAVVVAVSASLSVVFPGDPGGRPFCRDRRSLQALPATARQDPEIGRFHGAFDLTDKEVADYYWMVVFIPSAIVFLASVIYLLAGMAVAYSAPARHPFLRVVENKYCASKRGGVRTLAILNTVFAVIFGLLALFLGSSLLTLGSSCSVPLFWCYETASWGLVVLYGGTAFFLRRKAAVVMDECVYAARSLGLEMSGSAPEMATPPDMERRVHDGFKAWMGSSLLSSDDEDGLDRDYLEAGRPSI